MTLERSVKVDELIGHVLSGRRKATRYISPSMVVKVTAQRPRLARSRNATVIVTIGSPNYAERQFIKKARRAGEPFPVKRIQFIEWPRRRS